MATIDSPDHPPNVPAIAVHLGRMGHECTVVLDGVDVSRYLRGIVVEALVGEATRVSLDILAGVEVLGEAGELLRGLPRAEDRPVVEVVAAPPGSVIVVRVAGMVTDAVRARVSAQVGEVFPGHRVAVLGQGIELSILDDTGGAPSPGAGSPE